LLLNEPSNGVKLVVTAQEALRALGFSVQAVAFDVADELTVNVDLVQMAGAVVEVVDGLAAGQRGLCAVAERVVLMADDARLSVSWVEAGFGG
jgi:hypothetical protein